jgi:hypothetical protein
VSTVGRLKRDRFCLNLAMSTASKRRTAKRAGNAPTASPRNLDLVARHGLVLPTKSLTTWYRGQKWWEEPTDLDCVFGTVGEPGAFSHSTTTSVVKTGGACESIANQDCGCDPTAHAPRFSIGAVYC